MIVSENLHQNLLDYIQFLLKEKFDVLFELYLIFFVCELDFMNRLG